MPVSTLTQPDFTSQDPSLYKTALDDSASVLKRVAGAFAPHQTPTATMQVAVDPGMVIAGGSVTDIGGFKWGNLTNTSAVVTGLNSTVGLSAGMLVTLFTNPGHQVVTPNPPFAANTKILSVDSATQVTLDGPATQTGPFHLVFSQLVAAIVAPVGNPRIDLVVYTTTTGIASVVTGTPAASPVAPAIPVGTSPIAEILLQTSSTSITNSMITDIRAFPTNATPTIIGGTIDGAVIGGTTPAGGTFTDLVATETFTLSGTITPTSLAAQTNNWNPTGFADATVIRVSASPAVNLTGIVAGAAGRVLVLRNVGGTTISILPGNANSSASNRFATPDNGTLALYAGRAVILQYDAVSALWVVIGMTVGATSTTQVGLVEMATAAENATGTATALAVAPATQGSHITAAKAWLNMNGTGTIAIRSSYNVSSISDIGTGHYQINLTNAMADTNYAALSTSTQYVVSGFYSSFSHTTTAFQVVHNQSNTAAGVDSTNVNIAVFGN